MVDELKLYWAFIKTYVSTMTEYRFAFCIETIANMINIGSFYVFLGVVFSQITSVSGWTYDEALFLVSLNWLCTSISGFFFWAPMTSLARTVKEGSFDSYLIRPIHPLKFCIYRQFQYTFIGRLVLALYFLGKSIIALNINWYFGKILYFIVTIFSGTLIHGALLIIMGSISFWVIDNTEIMNLITSYDGIRTLIDFPLSAFSKIIQVFFTIVLPYAFVNFYPTVFMLDKTLRDAIFGSFIVYMPPFVAILLFIIAIRVWDKGIQRYGSVGS